jgi:hypothetical protein
MLLCKGVHSLMGKEYSTIVGVKSDQDVIHHKSHAVASYLSRAY